MYDQKTIDRFIAKINKTDVCWLWTGALNNRGYGVFHVGGRCGKTILAHRFSYMLEYSDILEQAFVLHKPVVCHNRACVRPDHLYLGDNTQNTADKKLDGTFNKPPITDLRGEKQPGHKLTAEQVMEIRHMYDTGQYTQKELGVVFGVSRSCINSVLNNYRWQHLTQGGNP